MTDFDMTWKNPTEAQAKALEFAMQNGTHFLDWHRRCCQDPESDEPAMPITEFDVAEMMCMAESSPWYAQAKSWVKGVYPAKGADEIWKIAGEAIVAIVDRGYQDGEWWNVVKCFPNTTIAALKLTAVIECVRMLRLVRERSLSVYSQWFEALPYLFIPGVKIPQAMKLLETAQGGQIVTAVVLSSIDPEFRERARQVLKKPKSKRA